ncbi:truncated fValyl tRNA Synthetase [Beggiatoa sp. PS]|nr:truncated fValyl tRNA Synthetase [Beggiatoa sp. PS]
MNTEGKILPNPSTPMFRHSSASSPTAQQPGGDEMIEFSLADRWIISLLQQVEEQVHQHIKAYRFDLLANTLYEFVWHEYCDWYLELSKPVLQSENVSEAAQQRGTRQTLVEVLETILRLLHPIMPFITEELWQKVAPLADTSPIRGGWISGEDEKTIMLQPYPQPQTEKIDTQAIQEIDWIKQFISGVRRIKLKWTLLLANDYRFYCKMLVPTMKRNGKPMVLSLPILPVWIASIG